MSEKETTPKKVTEEAKKEVISVTLPTAKDLVNTGAHWGHMKHRVYPKNYKNIHGVKSNTHVLNVYKTLEGMKETIREIVSIKKQGKQVLFVATKPSMKLLMAEFAQKFDMPYINERWVGGTFTNYDFVKKSIDKLKKLERDFATGEITKYPRHDQIEFKKEMERLKVKFGGLKNLDMSKLAAVFIQDLKQDKNAVKECLQKKVKMMALVDTNVDGTEVAFQIPCNDDSYNAFKLVLETIEKNLA